MPKQIHALHKGYKYLFYKLTPDNNRERFEATFIDILGSTIRLKKQDSQGSNYNTILCMPIEWIIHIADLQLVLEDFDVI